MTEPNLTFEDDPQISPEDLSWPIPAYQRVCSNGHLVTNTFNSYRVSRGADSFSYACKRCQLEANKRQKSKIPEDDMTPQVEVVVGTPESRAKLNDELAPEPGAIPDLQGRTQLEIQLDRIEKKLDDLVADRHPHTATRLLSARIEDLEAQIAELEKGPKEPSLEEMTFDQLKAKAASLGIEPPKGLRSAGVRKLIEDRLAASHEDPAIEVELNTPDPKDVLDAIQLGQASVQANIDHIKQVDEEAVAAEDEAAVVELKDDEVEEEEAPRRRRRRTPQTDEEINQRGEEAVERQKRRRRPTAAAE